VPETDRITETEKRNICARNR